MRRSILAITCLGTMIVAAPMIRGAGSPPPWAYGFAADGSVPPAGPPAAPDDGAKKKLTGSTGEFSLTEIRNAFGPADWFPGDHPTMPDVVAHGRRPDVRACSLCHYPNGKGRQENAGVSGLPVSYFIQTMNDFRNGNRKSADSRKANTNAMITIAKAPPPQE